MSLVACLLSIETPVTVIPASCPNSFNASFSVAWDPSRSSRTSRTSPRASPPLCDPPVGCSLHQGHRCALHRCILLSGLLGSDVHPVYFIYALLLYEANPLQSVDDLVESSLLNSQGLAGIVQVRSAGGIRV